MLSAAGGSPFLEWAVATLALAGEPESGDLHVVKPLGPVTLLAVVDGLGHGGEAATAAKRAVATLDRFAHEPLPAMIQRCHDALKQTRGVVLSAAVIDARRDGLSWLGVGNVEGVVLHGDWVTRSGRTNLVPRGGIVGAELPPVQPAQVSIAAGDTLILATDGIRSGFADVVSLQDPPQRTADQVLSRFGKGTDDALVLVARYLGRR